MTARIANLRTVDWQSLGINFVMVFSPGAFAGAPVTDIATVTFPGGGSSAEETALMKAVTDTFPGVTAVRVKEALDAVRAIVTNLVLGVRAASAITLIAAVLVLAGALAAGHRHRVYDAVILKTLGATRRQLMTAYAVEYLLLGSATVVFGVAAGSIAGWGVVVDFMALPFHWQVRPGPRGRRRPRSLLTVVVRPDRHLAGAQPQTRASVAQLVSAYSRQSAARCYKLVRSGDVLCYPCDVIKLGHYRKARRRVRVWWTDTARTRSSPAAAWGT